MNINKITNDIILLGLDKHVGRGTETRKINHNINKNNNNV